MSMHERSELPRYNAAAVEALNFLQMALRQAVETLPRLVTSHHFIVGHHSPASWQTTESWYRNQPEYDRDVAAALTDIALMSDALASLHTVTIARRPMGSLKLAKVKRVEL